jgi:hypothetical protein
VSTATARPASRAAVTEVYEDLRPLIRDTARKFADRYNQDREECLAEANLIFLNAYRTYDPARGRLEPRVCRVIWMRLLDKLRQKAARYQRRLEGALSPRRAGLTERDLAAHARPGASGRVDVYSDLGGVPSYDVPDFDREDFYGEVSPDGETVVRLFLECPEPIRILLLETPTPSEPATFRRVVRRYLETARGWTAKRIGSAFREVAAALEAL